MSTIDNITDQPLDDEMNEDLKGVQQQRLHQDEEFEGERDSPL